MVEMDEKEHVGDSATDLVSIADAYSLDHSSRNSPYCSMS
jgi:hypothetical protein